MPVETLIAFSIAGWTMPFFIRKPMPGSPKNEFSEAKANQIFADELLSDEE